MFIDIPNLPSPNELGGIQTKQMKLGSKLDFISSLHKQVLTNCLDTHVRRVAGIHPICNVTIPCVSVEANVTLNK